MIKSRIKNVLSALLLALVAASCAEGFSGDVIPFENIAGGADDNKGAIFVSPTGDDTNAGTSPTIPFKTIGQALKVTKPGMAINLMPGDYNLRHGDEIVLSAAMSGKDGQYLTIKAYDPENRPRIIAGGAQFWTTLSIQASYVIIDGIEFQGYNQTFTEADSLAAWTYAKASHDKTIANINDAAIYCTNGISIEQKKADEPIPHHVIVRNCVIHDFPGGGVGAGKADYVTFDNNVIYNNAWYSMYANSGISVLGSVDVDDNTTDHKIRITNNIVYNNHGKIPWASTSDFRYSDGNGIIMDVNDGKSQNTYNYQGRVLVANNVSYFNGGSGIHAYHAHNIDIINNTTYHNAQRYKDEYGEIYSHNGENNRIINNIMYARPNQRCNNFVKEGGAVYSNNVYYGGKYTQVAEDKYKDPLFVKIPTDWKDAADFHLQQGSPAIGFGAVVEGMPENDKDGKARGSSVDSGAYQSM